MKVPATAGKVLSEEEIRAFLKCPQYYKLGGKIPFSFRNRVLKKTIEFSIFRILRNSFKDPLRDLHSLLLRTLIEENATEQLLENQLKSSASQGMIWLNDFFQLLPPSKYIPILGHITPTFVISKTPVKLDISGVFRTLQNQTLHILAFTPYTNIFDMEKDPFTIWKLLAMRDFVEFRIQYKRPQAKIHIVTYDATPHEFGKLIYTSLDTHDLTKKNTLSASSIIKYMEMGYDFPSLPCPSIKCNRKSHCGK